MLLESYTRHLVRAVLSTNAIDSLPQSHLIPDHDEAWEARERKFHEENIKEINNLTRKMNTIAPSAVRRGIITLDNELKKIRGDTLRQNVWEGVQKRVQDIKDLELRGPPQQRNSFISGGSFQGNGGGFLGSLERMLSRSAESGNPEGHKLVTSEGMTSDGARHQAGGGAGLLVFVGLGVGALVIYRRPVLADAPESWTPLIPLVDPPQPEPEHESFVASSVAEPKYSVLEFLNHYLLEPFLTFVRFIHLALLFGPVILTSPMLIVGSQPRRRPGKAVSEPEENWGAVWWYGFLVKQMERAGPSFIKLAQWAASRADLFPTKLCEMMSKLHSNNDPHPFWYTKQVIEKSFEHSFDEIFEFFDETPIGCGAIAQVYKARLRPEILVNTVAEAERLTSELRNPVDGDRRIVTNVAVKVLHPRADKLVRRDIAIMSIFANIINAFPGMEWISLPEEVQVFGDMMAQQLDLRVEAANLDRFEYNFRNRGKVITFPKAIRVNGHAAATRRVLIEEFEDALPLKYFLRNGGGPYDEQIANFGLDAFLEMLLLDNWTHGDLHP
jgi:aarF domain-containing kinase